MTTKTNKLNRNKHTHTHHDGYQLTLSPLKNGSHIKGATNDPKPYVKCNACMYGPLSSCQISKSQTLMAVSNEPIENPFKPAKLNNAVNELQCGITTIT